MSVRSSGARSAVALAITATLTAACGGASPPQTDRSPSSPGEPSSPGRATTWLAIVAAEADVRDLNDETADLRDGLGHALIVSPVDCLEGLPLRAGDGYVLGAIGTTEQQVRSLVEEVGRTPISVVPVTVICTD